MQTAGQMNKQIVRHFRACENAISSLKTKICKMGSVKIKIIPTDHVRPPGEDIDIVTSFRHYRFVSSAKILGLLRNATGTLFGVKTVQRQLCGAHLR